MIKSIAFTAYPVSDMARARRFYEQTLGLTPAGSSSDHWQEYELGEGTFGIGMAPPDAPEYYRNRGTSLAFEVENVDAAFEKMKALGVNILAGPLDFPGCRMFVITDPDNNALYLHQIK